MTIRLFAKGPLKSVKRAAARYGIPVKCVNYGGRINPPSQRNEVICSAPCTAGTRVRHWFNELSTVKRGRGNTPGTLLNFVTEGCATLGGAHRRRYR